MTGYNMPPGCSPRDIPGNDARDPSPEAIAASELLEEIANRLSLGSDAYDELDNANTQIQDIIEKLVDELDHARLEIAHLQRYAQHTPACTKVSGRLQNRDIDCSCGLDHWRRT